MDRHAKIAELLKRVPQQPQVQWALEDQLMAAMPLLSKAGLYDAADHFRAILGNK